MLLSYCVARTGCLSLYDPDKTLSTSYSVVVLYLYAREVV